MSTEKPAGRAQFEEVLASLASIDRLRSRDELLAREADVTRRKADVAERVREVYSKQGVAVSDRLIEEGVDAYFDRRLRFDAPDIGMSSPVIQSWIHRRKIAKIAAITAVSVTGAFFAIEYGVVRPLHARAVAEHRKIQSAWQTASQRAAAAEGRVRLIEKGARHECEVISAEGDGALKSAASIAVENLDKLADQVERLSAAAKAERLPGDAPLDSDGVLNEKLLESASENTRALRASEVKTDELANAMNATMDRLHGLSRESKSLGEAWTAFTALNPSAASIAVLKPFYEQGVERVKTFGSPPEVASLRKKIQDAAGDVRVLAAMPEQLRSAATDALAISKDPKANELISRFLAAGVAACETGDVTKARRAFVDINGVAAQLEQSYTIRIVNRSSEYSRVWYNNPSRTGKLFYIVVEAVTPENEVLPLDITSEQDGSTRKVRVWAERVDEATYERVGQDKRDDGVIQNNVFGLKERGLLEPHYVMGAKAAGGDVSAGRLNHWPHR